MFTLHTTCIAVFWLNQPINFTVTQHTMTARDDTNVSQLICIV